MPSATMPNSTTPSSGPDGAASPGWHAAPPLSDAALEGTFWSFGLSGQPPHADFLVLAPDGRIGNYRNPNEDGWVVLDGRLALMSRQGVPTTIFDQAQSTSGDITALMGRVRIPGPPLIHVLRRVPHPAHPLHATPVEADRTARFLKRLTRPSRPNLVVLRAGETSLHRSWTKDIGDDDRSWDLCISYYGEDPAAVLADADYVTHQPDQRKFQALHDCFYPESPLWSYDRIWFPDDDLRVSWSAINHLFHLTRSFGLDLSQPSLTISPECSIAHGVTAQHPGSLLRFGDFVEIMCPLFSARALRLCIGSFRDSVSGFGLDHLWPSLLGGPRARMAIIDAVGIIHTRPIGSTYDIDVAVAEKDAHLQAYRFHHYSFGQIAIPA
ncbi:MAG: DUF707 domain-containing protein [Proteobacteria bacterium]|nr:DUF707 domain-containing protein [Pseudomonadota bacterium]